MMHQDAICAFNLRQLRQGGAVRARRGIQAINGALTSFLTKVKLAVLNTRDTSHDNQCTRRNIPAAGSLGDGGCFAGYARHLRRRYSSVRGIGCDAVRLEHQHRQADFRAAVLAQGNCQPSKCGEIGVVRSHRNNSWRTPVTMARRGGRATADGIAPADTSPAQVQGTAGKSDWQHTLDSARRAGKIPHGTLAEVALTTTRQDSIYAIYAFRASLGSQSGFRRGSEAINGGLTTFLSVLQPIALSRAKGFPAAQASGQRFRRLPALSQSDLKAVLRGVGKLVSRQECFHGGGNTIDTSILIWQ